MKRVLTVTFLLITLLMISGVYLVAAKTKIRNGTIRGGVYLDTDGDGRCSPTIPVPNIDVKFVNGNNHLTLYTGTNGTYGLPAAGRGEWKVTAEPDPAKWVVTSENPLLVIVHRNKGLVHTDVNFCVKPGSSTTTSSATADSTTVSNHSSSTTSTSSTTESEPDVFTSNYSVSETLLSSSATFTSTTNVAEVETVAAPTGTEWLDYLNLFRDMAGLPRFSEMESLSSGSRHHSKYMVLNDTPIAHNEDETNPLFDPAGRQAAKNGNIFATSQIQADYVWSVNFWTSAPFHLLPVINPDAEFVGYGRYNQTVGQFHMAAVLDLRSELGNTQNEAQYPIYFPGDGTETWIVRRSLYEWPDPLGNCPGYSVPTGSTLILQLGDGSLTPQIERHAVYQGSDLIESCAYNETTYVNPDTYAQSIGRTIIGEQDAIVIIPKSPLPINETYRVEVVVDGQTYSWSFSTRKGPPEQ